MRKQFLNKIKNILELQRNEIIEKIKMHANIDIDIDGDETDEIQGKILALTNAQLISRNKDKIIKIDNALNKISSGKFGYCDECEEEISEKRLLVNPEFITCIVCAEKLEIINKRNGIK